MNTQQQNNQAQWDFELKRRNSARSASFVSFIPSTWRGRITCLVVFALFMWLMQDYAKKTRPANLEKQKHAQIKNNENKSRAIKTEATLQILSKEK